jgi:hypothetical protein
VFMYVTLNPWAFVALTRTLICWPRSASTHVY